MAILQHITFSRIVLLGVAFLGLKFIYNAWNRYLVRRRFERQYGCKPVVSVFGKDPILGLDVMYETLVASKEHKILEVTRSHGSKYGNTFRTKLGALNVIRTVEPENVKSILATNFKDYSLAHRKNAFQPLLGHGIFINDGEQWADSRAMIRPNFIRDQVADLETFEELIPDLFALIPRDGSTVDLQELFFCYTMDSATDFLFGNCVKSLKRKRLGEKSDHEFATAFSYAQEVGWLRFRMGALSKFYRNRKGDEANHICREVVSQFVDDALAYRDTLDLEKEPEKEAGKKREKYLFLHGIARHTSDRTRLRDELMNVFLAGRDTTASLLSNMFFILAKRPDIWKKLRDEVETTLEGRVPTYEELRNMKYIKYCLNESLRLYPVVPLNGRLCINDTHLPTGGGPDGKSAVFVPKGTFLSYNLYNMHRRTDYYGEDAEEFRPERWATLRPGWEYLPFNGGPRICVGQQYALTEAGYVTVRLAQEFKTLESRDPGPWVEQLALTLSSLNGTKVALTPADK